MSPPPPENFGQLRLMGGSPSHPFHPLKRIGRMTLRTPSRAAVVHLNFRTRSTFPVPVCTVPSSMDRTSRCNKVDMVRIYASYRLNLFLLKGQICVPWTGRLIFRRALTPPTLWKNCLKQGESDTSKIFYLHLKKLSCIAASSNQIVSS